MKVLPPGQKESNIFPRFGLPQYANRFPTETDKIRIQIGGDLEEFEIGGDELHSLSRKNQKSDFHCVTTWSKLDLNWSGYSFKDFYTSFILPKVPAGKSISFIVLKAQDGFKTSLSLTDLIQENVLLADTLENEPLNIEHGAPVRIVAPDHYGYKNVKHINSIDCYFKFKDVKKGLAKFIDHPRARVAFEERAVTGPSLLFRWLYKFGVNDTIKDFEKAIADYRAQKERR